MYLSKEEVGKMGSLSKNIKERMAELEISAHALEKRAGLKTSSVQNIDPAIVYYFQENNYIFHLLNLKSFLFVE